ncbi:ATP-binding protein [Uliginosibacterium sediminicola]|uniref:histidine kinase n=1 Tax=Uliginosibacterium sediminicola TaxID=2024550 RepID=A0ABU9Z0P8_9RHOO
MPRLRFPWPRTLLWRTFLLIVLLMGLSLFAWFQIYQQFAIKPRTHQTAQMVYSIVNLTRAALLASDATQRTALLQDLIHMEGIRVYPAESTDQIVAANESAFMRGLADELRLRLGPSTITASSLEGQTGFYVSFILDPYAPDDRYWLMIPAERVARGDVVGWIGWGLAVALLSMIGAYLLVFGITRPLKALEQAARSVGRGELPPPLPEKGSREMAAVANAFNQMSRDLNQLESDRALILAGVSHDLRTPLSRLRLGIEMSGASAADIAAMSTDIDDMDRVIKQFLDFARDAHSESSEPCEPGALLDELAERYARRGARISVSRHTSVTLNLRPQSIRRAVTNLIDNALRYCPPDTPIELRLDVQATQIFIDVVDQGPGIPADAVERLKRPFTRLESARSNVQGSGLGLAIVERIARLHEGALDLLPNPAGGLIARIQLPGKLRHKAGLVRNPLTEQSTIIARS